MAMNRMRLALRGAVVAAVLVLFTAPATTVSSLAGYDDRLSHVPSDFLHQVPVPLNIHQVLAALSR